MNGRTRTACLAVVAACMVALGSTSSLAGEAAPGKPAKKKAARKSRSSKQAASPQVSGAQIQQLAKSTRLTSDAVRTALAYMRRYKPVQAREIGTMLKADDKRLRTYVREASTYARQLAALKASNPTRYARQERTLALGAQAELLVERYNQASEVQKPQVEVELTGVLGKLFELRVEEERAQLEALRKQADQLQARIEARVENKDRIVDRQLTSRLGIDEILAW